VKEKQAGLDGDLRILWYMKRSCVCIQEAGMFLAGVLPGANVVSSVLVAALQAGQVGTLSRHRAV